MFLLQNTGRKLAKSSRRIQLLCLPPQKWRGISSEERQKALKPRGHRSTGTESERDQLRERTMRHPLADHKDLSLSKFLSSQYLTTDAFRPINAKLLSLTLQGYIPEDNDADQKGRSRIHLGMQQAYFPAQIPGHDLLADGTDKKFLPGHESIWKYRLWAGGLVSYNVNIPFQLTGGTSYTQLEYVKDVRIQGADTPTKIFATIVKKFVHLPSGVMGGETSIASCMLEPDVPALTESYTLCFLRHPPSTNSDRAGARSPPSEPIFSYTMTPDSALLFRFSALSFNAHRIHLDPGYARDEYGMKTSVVHGPLTQVLMAEFLRRSLSNHNIIDSPIQQGMQPFIKSMEYTNLRPLYVDEPMTLCCKRTEDSAAGQSSPPLDSISSMWDVWIQTGEGQDARLAVKAKVGVAYTDDQRTKADQGNDGQRMTGMA